MKKVIIDSNGKPYMNTNGKVLTVEIQTNLQAKNTSPSILEQVIFPDNGYEGLSYVRIAPMALEEKNVSLSTDTQEITADEGYDGLGKVTIEAMSLQQKTVSPRTTQQTITPDLIYNGFSKVIIEAMSLQEKTVSPRTTQQTITPDSTYNGLSEVTVNAVTSSIDSNIQAGNIKKNISILGVVGTYDAPIIQAALEYKERGNTTLGATGLKLTVNESGTYRISWVAARNYSGSTTSFVTRVYVDGSAKGTEHSTWTRTYFQQIVEENIALTAGQTVEVYAKSRSNAYYTLVGNLVIEKTS